MRKIILDLAVTLDGYIEGPNGETDWCILDDDMDFEGFLSRIDSIFYGRVSYGQWGHFRPDATAGEAEKAFWENVHSKKKYVFSRNAQPDNKATYIAADLENQVATLKQQEGKDIWLYGGAQLIRTFIRMNLIDVYRLSVHPVVLGAGKPLFQQLSEQLHLQLTGINRFRSGVVQLIYERQQ